MQLSRLVGRRTKDSPREAQQASHKLLLRGGYARPVAAGIYSILPLGKRVLAKLEALIREEMEAIDGQEVLMPVMLPRELWEESGRYASIDASLVRFKDRNAKDFVLGMTHEEAVVALARTEISSYRQLPCMLYQIQTKVRDEPRPRGGLIRVREFTMKDAYSFHTSPADLAAYYERCWQAYNRIFKRAGLINTVVVESDTGMIGGSRAHEFMLVSASGEDSLILCRACGYSANREVATCRLGVATTVVQAAADVETPGTKTIDELCKLLGVTPKETAKAVFYQLTRGKESALVFVALRGDRQVNEVKLLKALGGGTLAAAGEAAIRAAGAEPGYATPVALTVGEGLLVIADLSLQDEAGLVAGANRAGWHRQHVNARRDFPEGTRWADVAAVEDGDACPACSQALHSVRGIEIGNIFQLGTKYSEQMEMRYLDDRGVAQTPHMGCYGIGVGRLMAAVIEDNHDERGPRWPWAVAPFDVHLCAIESSQPAVAAAAAALYKDLAAAGLAVLWDDTDDKPGAQFGSADLIGAPVRLVVSPKTLPRGVAEYKRRDDSARGDWALADVAREILRMKAEALTEA